MRADNEFGDDGAASLAPSLERMMQLKSLNLNRTLRACAAAGAVSACLQAPAVHGWCMLQVGWMGAGL